PDEPRNRPHRSLLPGSIRLQRQPSHSSPIKNTSPLRARCFHLVWRKAANALHHPSDLQEQLVSRVVCLVPMRVAQIAQESLELFLVRRRHLDTDQDATVVIPLITVVEQADIPVLVHAGQEFTQSTGALWKLET